MLNQPYSRRGGREPGAALSAMLKGRPTHLPNPMDLTRLILRKDGSRMDRLQTLSQMLRNLS